MTTPLRAAAYCRLSKEDRDPDKTRDSESIDVQRRKARAFADEKGWTFADAHAFKDDGISGAEYQKRPGLRDMLAAAERREFDVLIVRHLDRLGRDQMGNSNVLYRLRAARVKVWTYSAKAVVGTKGFEGFKTSFDNTLAEMERERASVRTRDALRDKFTTHGHAIGAAPFGYVLVPAPGATKDPKSGRIAKVLALADKTSQAYKVARRILLAVIDHGSFRRIAIELNADRVPAIRGRTWGRRQIHDMAHNPTYRGRYIVGRRLTVYEEEGTKRRVRSEDILETPCPSILSSVEIRKLEARLKIRPVGGTATPKHMASGFLTCGECGSAIIRASTGKQSDCGRRWSYYACSKSHQHTKAACVGVGRRNQEAVERAIMEAFAELLDERRIAEVLSKVRTKLAAPGDRDGTATKLRADLADAERRSRNLTDSLAGEDNAAVRARLREALADQERRATEARGELARHEATKPVRLDVERAMRDARGRLRVLRAGLQKGGVEARPVLAAILGDRKLHVKRAGGVGRALRWEITTSIPVSVLLNDGQDPSAVPHA